MKGNKNEPVLKFCDYIATRNLDINEDIKAYLERRLLQSQSPRLHFDTVLFLILNLQTCRNLGML